LETLGELDGNTLGTREKKHQKSLSPYPLGKNLKTGSFMSAC
jgi:hypothetical protein